MSLSNLPMIKARRKSLGLSLDDLAERVGISKTYLWELESGRRSRPSAKVAVALSSALDLSLDVLLGIDHARKLTYQDRLEDLEKKAMDLLAAIRALKTGDE